MKLKVMGLQFNGKLILPNLYCVLLLLITSISFAQSPVPPGAKLEKVAAGFSSIEGPIWWNSIPVRSGSDTVGLLFSDISANTMYKWTQSSGVTVFMKPSLVSNGLTIDLQNRLVMTQMDARRIARLEKDGSQTVLASSYNGKKLNSPNDIVVKSDGAIFFTDPPLNIPQGQKQELPWSGIFRISPYGSLQVLDSSLSQPNGICFTPDEKKLYVNDSQARRIYAWDVVNDSTLANKKLFDFMNAIGYADGMKVDPQGNLFSAGPLGIWVFSPAGAVLDTIIVPGQTSNCNWGDSDRKTLYITASNTLYRIRLAPATGIKGNGYMQPKSFQLFQNYPNPFSAGGGSASGGNPSTTISYSIPAKSFVSLKVFDILGREVRTLVNERQAAGNYSFKFNAGELASGVYFYSMEADNFIETKKFLLLK